MLSSDSKRWDTGSYRTMRLRYAIGQKKTPVRGLTKPASDFKKPKLKARCKVLIEQIVQKT